MFSKDSKSHILLVKLTYPQNQVYSWSTLAKLKQVSLMESTLCNVTVRQGYLTSSETSRKDFLSTWFKLNVKCWVKVSKLKKWEENWVFQHMQRLRGKEDSRKFMNWKNNISRARWSVMTRGRLAMVIEFRALDII